VIVAEVGENIRAGQPVLASRSPDKRWLSFNAREDCCTASAWGDGRRRRTGRQNRPRRSSPSSCRSGQFATWQAERAVGDHDRNTLRLRLDPLRDAAAFEPG
jgi:HlyD family secretion protein